MDVEGGLANSEPEETVRTCAKCGESKPAGEFHRSRTGQFTYCAACRRAYDRRYYAERGRSARLARVRAWRAAQRAWMDSLKEGRACADCGETFPTCAMHWDHLPGHAKFADISVMVTRFSRAMILDELAKCELVCANCHVLRTVARATRTVSEDETAYRFEGAAAA